MIVPAPSTSPLPTLCIIAVHPSLPSTSSQRSMIQHRAPLDVVARELGEELGRRRADRERLVAHKAQSHRLELLEVEDVGEAVDRLGRGGDG